MIGRLIAFECKQRARSLSTYVYALALFAAGGFMMLGSGGVFRSVAVAVGGERVHANSPYALFLTTATVAMLGLFTIAAVFGQAAHRDFEHRTWALIFTTNVGRRAYLLGRFCGAFVFSAVLFLAIGLAQWLGSIVVAFVRPSRLGPTSFGAYVWPYVVQVWPMLFFAGALFFSLAALSRRMAPVYVGVVVLVLGYVVASILIQDVESWTAASLLDPFGFIAFDRMVRYWTPVERNRDLVSVLGLLGLNRLLWCGAGVGLLALAVGRFRFELREERGGAEPAVESAAPALAYPRTLATPTFAAWLRATFAAAWLYVREVLRSPIYWAFALCGLAFVLIVFAVTKTIYGTATWPVTYQVLENARGSFRLFALITLTFYAGEVVFRERDAGVQEVVDATSAPTWVLVWSKLLALFAITLSLVLISGVAALVAQVSRGFFAIDAAQYFVALVVIEWSSLALLGALAVTLHVLCNDKYLGHFAMVGYFASSFAFDYLGIEDRLVQYAAAPGVPYSDLNGYGGLLVPFGWFRMYWGAFAVLLIVAAHAFYPRGRERSSRARWAAARQRFRGGWRRAAVFAAVAFVGTGAFLFYQTHVAQAYVTAKAREQQSVDYERRYKAWQTRPQPRIVGARVTFDVAAEAERVDARGSYRLQNKSSADISEVLIGVPAGNEVRALRIAGAARPSHWDEPLGVRVYRLPEPLRPGAQADLDFEIRVEHAAFRHKGVRTEIARNGTFLNNLELPILGYQERLELTRDEDRADYGFPPKQRMASRDDRQAAQNHYLRQDSDFIRLVSDVITSPDQIGLAPGRLESTWDDGGRRHARFVLDTPVLDFFSVLSARYAVKRDRWRDVALEIYHYPDHTYNLERMIRGMKDALEYCTTAFGPYPHRVLRIVEFPRYEDFAQAFPNTVPYSESIGFIARVRDDEPDDLNYPYYVTAHEVAHQWWAHQVIGANVRGATMASETLAQYSALMVMKKAYDPQHMRRFLKFELDRYLAGRATETERELPIGHNEDQPYVHYNKGSVAMYALQDMIGQDRVDRALRRYLEAFRWRGPPYSTAADLIGYLREETPEAYRYLIDDLFETITLYDNRATSATLSHAEDGSWDVVVQVVTRKYRSDEHGEQTELDFADYMDVGALDDDGNALFLERRKLPKGASEQRFRLRERPAKVGVDPLHKLIDRSTDDNVVTPSSVR